MPICFCVDSLSYEHSFLIESEEMEELCNAILFNSYDEYDFQSRRELTKNSYELNHQKVIVQTLDTMGTSRMVDNPMTIEYGEYRKFYRYKLASALQKIAEKASEYMVDVYLPKRSAAEKKNNGKSK